MGCSAVCCASLACRRTWCAGPAVPAATADVVVLVCACCQTRTCAGACCRGQLVCQYGCVQAPAAPLGAMLLHACVPAPAAPCTHMPAPATLCADRCSTCCCVAAARLPACMPAGGAGVAPLPRRPPPAAPAQAAGCVPQVRPLVLHFQGACCIQQSHQHCRCMARSPLMVHSPSLSTPSGPSCLFAAQVSAQPAGGLGRGRCCAAWDGACGPSLPPRQPVPAGSRPAPAGAAGGLLELTPVPVSRLASQLASYCTA